MRISSLSSASLMQVRKYVDYQTITHIIPYLPPQEKGFRKGLSHPPKVSRKSHDDPIVPFLCFFPISFSFNVIIYINLTTPFFSFFCLYILFAHKL